MPDTENPDKKQILVREHLFTVPKSSRGKTQLIGSKCNNCGEVVFSRKRCALIAVVMT